MTPQNWTTRGLATAATAITGLAWGMGHGFADPPSPAAPISAAPGSSGGLTFVVSGLVKGPSAQSETESAATSTEDTVVPCDRVDISLTIGRLSVENGGHDARVSFSELPPGTYDYTVTCHKSRHLQGEKQGSLVIEYDGRAIAEVDVLVPIAPVEVLTMQGSGSAELVALTVGSTPDQTGGDLDSKVRDLTVLTSVGYVTSRAAHQGIEPLATTDLGI